MPGADLRQRPTAHRHSAYPDARNFEASCPSPREMPGALDSTIRADAVRLRSDRADRATPRVAAKLLIALDRCRRCRLRRRRKTAVGRGTLLPGPLGQAEPVQQVGAFVGDVTDFLDELFAQRAQVGAGRVELVDLLFPAPPQASGDPHRAR